MPHLLIVTERLIQILMPGSSNQKQSRLFQMLDVVDPAILFENCVYVSGNSPVYVRHFNPPAGSLAEDIGSRGRAAIEG